MCMVPHHGLSSQAEPKKEREKAEHHGSPFFLVAGPPLVRVQPQALVIMEPR